MDPLHPETAVPRIKELSKQLDRVLSDFKKATTAGKLAELEREGILVVQEMALVAPRLHEVVMQTSRSQRTAIARGLVEKPVEKTSLTPEEEERFAKLRSILKDAEAQFNGKDARNKETGKVYSNLYFLTIKPFDTDAHRYGIVVSMRNEKEILSFGDEKVIDFLNDYEPVEKSLQSVKKEPTETSQSVTATEVEQAKPKAKKTTKKAKK